MSTTENNQNNQNNQSIENNKHIFEKMDNRISYIETMMKRPFVDSHNHEIKSSQYSNSQNSSASHMQNNIDESMKEKYRESFVRYLRTGSDLGLKDLEYKSALSGGNAKNDIGYSITYKMVDYISHDLLYKSSMRAISNVMQISTEALEVFDNKDDIIAAWSNEHQHNTDKNTSIQFLKQIIQTHELFAEPKATQKLLDDPRIDVEKWLSDMLSDTFAAKENYAFINGDGVGKPKGIITYADDKNTIASGAKNDIITENLIKLYYTLPDKYIKNAKFLMNRATAEKIRLLKNSEGNFIWQTNIVDNNPNKLFGLDVIITSDMPRFETNNVIIALADFQKSYQIIDRGPVRILHDPYTNKPFVKFYSKKEVGGDVVNTDAMRFMKVIS